MPYTSNTKYNPIPKITTYIFCDKTSLEYFKNNFFPNITEFTNENITYPTASRPTSTRFKIIVIIANEIAAANILITNNVDWIFTFFAVYTVKTLEVPNSDTKCAVPAILMK